MKFKQVHQDTVNEALQRSGMAREDVGKTLTLLNAIFDRGDGAGKLLDQLVKETTPKKAEKGTA